jgi:SAM-dependent methyltransferase
MADSRGETRLCFLRGDMRALPLQRESLDGAMNIFTSFGYFESDDEHQRVLDGVARALKPGARFFMDFFNPAPVIAKLPMHSEKMAGDVAIIEDKYLDAQSHRICKRIEESGPGVQRVILESVRAYTSVELEALLTAAGLTVQKRYGDFSRSAFDPDSSPRCILITQKSRQ